MQPQRRPRLWQKSDSFRHHMPEVMGVHAEWNIFLEARFFVRLVMLGKITPENAKEEILMSESQLAWLLESLPFECVLTKKIYERRRETYKCFVDLYRKEMNRHRRLN